MEKKKMFAKGALFLALLMGLASCGETVSSSGATSTPSTGTSSGTTGGTSTSTDATKWTITFDSQGGSTVAAIQVAKGTAATKPTDPTYEGHSFEGWCRDSYCTVDYVWSSLVTANLTLYAKWAVGDHLITFESNGGSAVESIAVADGVAATKPTDPTKEGNAFGGWYKETALTNAYDWSDVVNSSFTLYAKWNASHTITFNSNGGSSVASLVVLDGAVATKPTDPTKEGNSFGGWYTEEALTNSYNWSNTVTADLSLYAKWTTVTTNTIYFRDVSWWNKDAAGSAIYLYNSDTDKLKAWPGTLMTYISYDETNKYNYWKFDVSSTYAYAIFTRVSGDGATDWGAQTVDITLTDRGTHNMYDISSCAEAWGNPGVTGVWADYTA